nr:ABC transporter substrate-binding protein [Nocardioides sp. zg-DK7169]
MAAVYDTLLRYDQEAGTYEPQLAESLESDDDITWTLKLRDGVTFTDGTPLDAKAVLGSLEYYIANYGFQGNLIQSNAKSMKAVDDTTVVFTMNKPWATFPNMLASGPGLIMAPAAYANPEKFKPIGAGPFVFTSQAAGEKLVVSANEDYVGGRPHLDSIEFVMLGADVTKYESLKAGEIDVAYLRADDMVQQARRDGWPGMVNAVNGGRTVNINARPDSATGDVRVRQAVSAAIDAELYLERMTGNGDLADRGLMSESSTWNTDVEPTGVDIEKAKELLAEAKADGFDGKLRFLSQSDSASRDGAVAFKAMLEAVGFEIELDLVNTIAEQTKAIYVDGDFDLATGSSSVFDQDPYASMSEPLSSTSLSNPGRYANPEMDRLLGELQGHASPEEGAETMAAIEEIFHEDVPYISLAGGAFFNVWDKDVHGIKPTSQTAILFDDAWVAED